MKEDLQGLATLKEQKLKCTDCGKVLANIELIQSNTDRNAAGQQSQTVQYKIINCFTVGCNGSSFWSDFFEGKSIAGADNDSYVLESDDIYKDGNVIKVQLKCQNRRK